MRSEVSRINGRGIVFTRLSRTRPRKNEPDQFPQTARWNLDFWHR